MKRRKAEAATTQQKQASPAPPQRPAPSPRKADRQPLPANQAPPLNSRRGAFLLGNAGQTFPAARTSPPSSPGSTNSANSANFPNFLISLIAGFGRLPQFTHSYDLVNLDDLAVFGLPIFQIYGFMGFAVRASAFITSNHKILLIKQANRSQRP